MTSDIYFENFSKIPNDNLGRAFGTFVRPTVYDCLGAVFDRLGAVFDRFAVVFDRLDAVLDRKMMDSPWTSGHGRAKDGQRFELVESVISNEFPSVLDISDMKFRNLKLDIVRPAVHY